MNGIQSAATTFDHSLGGAFEHDIEEARRGFGSFDAGRSMVDGAQRAIERSEASAEIVALAAEGAEYDFDSNLAEGRVVDCSIGTPSSWRTNQTSVHCIVEELGDPAQMARIVAFLARDKVGLEEVIKLHEAAKKLVNDARDEFVQLIFDRGI